MMSAFRPGRKLLVALAVIAMAPAAAGGQESDPDAPPFVATPMELTEAMLDIAAVSPGDVVYDLGSGDGRLVITAAARGARGVGIEYDGSLVELSRANAERAGVTDRTSFLHADIFESEIRDATVVLLYLGAAFNLRLRPILLDQLRPGSRVVSHAFHMGDWEPDTLVVLGSGAERANLYAWVIPARVDGFWYLEIEGVVPFTLEFFQRYQEVTGSLKAGERSFALQDGRLDGETIRFEARDTGSDADLAISFEGTLVGGRFSGTMTGPGPWDGRRWTAVRFSDPARLVD
jgi:SAM-dependent methyltransferase